jgi:NADPH:quinone reductase-like Zn-dependent oxidoreductase
LLGNTPLFTFQRKLALKVLVPSPVSRSKTDFFKNPEAATIPLASLTAAVGLFETSNLALPEPWDPATKPTPLLVYGGASAVGAFVIQLAKKANIHPIIAVAGNGIRFVESLINRSKGDTIVDYRNGDEAVVSGIQKALNGAKIEYAYDAVCEKNSFVNISRVLDPNGRVTYVLPIDEAVIPNTVYRHRTSVADVHKEYKDFGFVHFQNMARGLAEGWFKGHPHQVVEGGLGGVEKALKNLKDGKASAVKYVFRIGDAGEGEVAEGLGGH